MPIRVFTLRFDPEKHQRRSIRLPGYEYSRENPYFVTICCGNRQLFLAEICSGSIILSRAGQVVETCLLNLPRFFPGLEIDSHIIMPNHMHGIFWIINPPEKGLMNQGLMNQTPTVGDESVTGETDWILMKNTQMVLGKMVRHFKAKSARLIRNGIQDDFSWQRNYHERIIRNESELNRFRQYMENNPALWPDDEENPGRII